MYDQPEVDYVEEAYGTPLIQAYQLPLPEQQPRSGVNPALANSWVAMQGAGRVYGFTVTNTKGSAQFALVFDLGTVPATGAVPIMGVDLAASSAKGVYWGVAGRWFDRGIVIANSSTIASLTIGSADCFFDVQYTPQVI